MAVDGIKGLNTKLNALSNTSADVLRVVKTQAEVVRGAAVKLCPVYAPRGKPIPGVSSGELRGSIYSKVEQDANATIGTVYTDKEYAIYVEFGTGPVGQANHEGISPEVPVAYTQQPWVWPDAEGGFHYTEGQPAQPFMYPALKSTEKTVIAGLKNGLQASIRKVSGSK